MSWGISALATSRGRSGLAFFFISFFTSPLLGLIIVLLIKNLTDEDERELARKAEEEQREKRRKEDHELQLESLRSLSATFAAKPSDSSVTTEVVFSVATELERLANLKTQGILTDIEFAEQKAILLKRAAGQS